MRLLILGGTHFLGRHLATAALARGHSVSLFHRGKTGSDLFPEAEYLPGDRDGNLEALGGRAWDAVIDTSGYVPRLARASADKLKGAVGHYTFISTISVYAGFPETPHIDESSPVGKLEDPTIEEVTGESYGPLKALCEQAVAEVFPEHTLAVRPGLIVGPYDPTDRFTYWPSRVARGGEMLAPGRAGFPIQFIDARDLAAWTLTMTEQRQTGTFNATGPDHALTMGELLDESKRASGSDVSFTWVPDAFLGEAGAEGWSELPLWVSETEAPGLSNVNCAQAYAAGLSFRPLEETVRDTLAWAATRPQDYQMKAGLSPEKEAEILAAWHRSE
ncbi:MAG TPA: NAD-dependent epimerase/dehydratase family protein [Ktedonobacterales bacterium]|jgi:2'-hydroxyisoflavone reductase|nr:NAD-dependent epimerase/dehydratase family protein [Ktedonobacterales bacterium]